MLLQKLGWTVNSTAQFDGSNRCGDHEFKAENHPRTFEFKDCKSISFWDNSLPPSEGYLMTTTGTGKFECPAGVRILVSDGTVKLADNKDSKSGGNGTAYAEMPSPPRNGPTFTRSNTHASNQSNDGFVVTAELPRSSTFSQQQYR